MQLKEKIENLIRKEIESLGCKLRNVEIKQKGKAKELIITLGKKDKISIGDCVKVSRKIEPILEKENLFEGPWYLIVSSANLEDKEIEELKLK